MRRIYLDVNVVLDYLLRRNPWIIEAEQLIYLAESRQLQVVIYSNVLIQAYHYLQKYGAGKLAKAHLLAFSQLVEFVPLTHAQLVDLLGDPSDKDIEDQMQVSLAEANGCDCIITRDAGFASSSIEVVTPGQFLTNF